MEIIDNFLYLKILLNFILFFLHLFFYKKQL